MKRVFALKRFEEKEKKFELSDIEEKLQIEHA